MTDIWKKRSGHRFFFCLYLNPRPLFASTQVFFHSKFKDVLISFSHVCVHQATSRWIMASCSTQRKKSDDVTVRGVVLIPNLYTLHQHLSHLQPTGVCTVPHMSHVLAHGTHPDQVAAAPPADATPPLRGYSTYSQRCVCRRCSLMTWLLTLRLEERATIRPWSS